MPDEDRTFSGSLVLDLRIWWGQMHTLYQFISTPCGFFYTEQKKRERKTTYNAFSKEIKKKSSMCLQHKQIFCTGLTCKVLPHFLQTSFLFFRVVEVVEISGNIIF